MQSKIADGSGPKNQGAALLLERDESFREIAESLHTTHTTVRRWASGVIPNDDAQGRLESHLGIPRDSWRRPALPRVATPPHAPLYEPFDDSELQAPTLDAASAREGYTRLQAQLREIDSMRRTGQLTPRQLSDLRRDERAAVDALKRLPILEAAQIAGTEVWRRIYEAIGDSIATQPYGAEALALMISALATLDDGA